MAERAKQVKYITGEALLISNDQVIRSAVDKAYPKFSSTLRNLLVVVDDLFVPMRYLCATWARAALYKRPDGKFSTPSHQRLGAVGCFWPVEYGHGGVAYEMPLFINPYALPSCDLPEVFTRAFHGRALTAG